MSGQARQLAVLAGCVATACAVAVVAEPGDRRVSSAPVGRAEIWIDPGTQLGAARVSHRGETIARLSSSGPGSGARAARAEGLATPGYLRRERPRVRTAGRRFMVAYFAYEVGEGGKGAARRVRALASGPLAELLLAGPARMPAMLDEPPARARIAALDIEFDKPPDTAVLRGEVQRDGDRAGFGLVLARERGNWTVVEVIE